VRTQLRRPCAGRRGHRSAMSLPPA
jgi:hypothetical protein